MWMYAVVKMQGGSPIVDTEIAPYHGFVHIAQKGIYGIYLFSGTLAQLVEIGKLPTVIPLVAMTDDGISKYTELNDTIIPYVRNKANVWLANLELPLIPEGWTYKKLLTKLVDVFEVTDIGGNWVKDE